MSSGVSSNRFGLPHLGLGLGLRSTHYNHVLTEHPEVDFFEVFPENFLYTQGRPMRVLRELAERYPINLHAIAINIGSSEPLNMDYLTQLKRLAAEIKAVYLSDHLCWTGVAGHNLHSVIPMPMTEATLQHTAERVKRVQDFMGRPLFLENSPGYLAFRMSSMSEAEFMVRLCELADCGILFDLNNLFQGAFNYDFDAAAVVDMMPVDRIGYCHVAGHADHGTYLLDTHDHPVKDEVWELYRRCEARTGGRTTMLEWDNQVPAFPDLYTEMLKTKAYMATPQHVG